MSFVKLRNNFVWNIFGSASYLIFQWGCIAIFSKLGKMEWVGTISLTLGIVSPIILLSNLQIRAVWITEKDNVETFIDYILLQLSMTFVIIVLFLIILVTSGYESSVKLFILIMGFAKIVENFSELIYADIQKKGRMRPIALSLITKSSISYFILTTVSLCTGNIVFGAVCYFFIILFVLICFDIRAFSKYNNIFYLKLIIFIKKNIKDSKFFLLKSQFGKTKKLFFDLLPLGIITMLTSYIVNIPRYFIELNKGLVELGIYTSVGYLWTAVCYIALALGNNTLPLMSIHAKNYDIKKMNRLMFYLTGFSIVVGIVSVTFSYIFGEFILEFLYGEAYVKYKLILVFMMLLTPFAFLNLFIFNYLVSIKIRSLQLWFYVFHILVLLILCNCFISRWGILGAVYAQISAYGLQLVLSIPFLLIYSRKYFHKYACN